MEEKKTNKKMLLGIGAAAAVIAVVAVIVLAARETPEQKVARLLDLGNQYLLDLDYEQAIASYDEVLSIEPQNEKAVEGEVNAYLAWSEALIAEGDFDLAAEVLQTGYDKFGDERLQAAASAVAAKKSLENERARLQTVAEDIAELCATENYESVSLRLTDESELFELLGTAGEDRYIFLDGEVGAVGLYLIGDKYYAYYGDYAGELREGRGLWISNYEHDYDGYGYSIGVWSNDMPNGEQDETTYHGYITEEARNMRSQSGMVIDGLWDGEVYWEFGDGSAFVLHYGRGKVNVIGTDEENEANLDGHIYIVGNAAGEDGENTLHFDETAISQTWGMPGYADTW